MRCVIVTGMSGAGKSTALNMLEDAGYFCVDNLPTPLLEKFAEMMMFGSWEHLQNVALGVDIRTEKNMENLEATLNKMQEIGLQYEILFLNASDEVLVKRYKETRRKHPISKNERVERGIAEEREKLEFLKKRADYVLDTSQVLTRELKVALEKIFVENKEFKSLMVTVLSFGFKYGVPVDADLVFDVRFLPNPYYIEGLRPLTGNDAAVSNYVMNCETSHEFLDKLEDMVKFLIPRYILEGKHQLVIAVGCTGGKHRSVTLANQLYHRLRIAEDYAVRIEHRDIEKDAIRQRV